MAAASRRAAPSAALAAWQELNDRQQGTLAVIFELDQATEQGRRQDAARGEYSRAPASEWRAIDFAHDPSGLGTTEMQRRLAGRGWHNQGNGSTIAALQERGLIAESSRPTSFGRMLRVRLTRLGRAAARAGLAMPATGKAALSERSWEVLALLWAAGQDGGYLQWGPSVTIDRVLIGKHVPPLAEPVAPAAGNRYRGGYRITERGCWFYREFYGQHVAAHPSICAPHPDGPAAEPWPPRADEILAAHRSYYGAVCAVWAEASQALQSAEQEAAADPATPPAELSAELAGQVRDRDRLWRETARKRAGLAASQKTALELEAARAARAYAAAALAALAAAVAGSDPLAVLEPPVAGEQWDEQRLAPPAGTGIAAIDEQAVKLHAAAVGVPVPRRGPPPSRRRRSLPVAVPVRAEPPGAAMAALADFLRGQTSGGVLVRRLHRAAGPGGA